VSQEISDEDLLSRVARGDKAAFGALVARHRRRLTAMTARLLGRAAADEVVQETFTRAWVQAPSWQASGAARYSYAAWLSRVAMNLAIDQTRRRVTTVDIADCDVVDPVPDAEAALIRGERLRLLQSAIKQLPARQREAVSLTYDAELSNAEAAGAMGISVGAFELLLVRARRSLRTALKGDA
jgi:RNA polymerase sigma-70 factor (ECF subfamily)